MDKQTAVVVERLHEILDIKQVTEFYNIAYNRRGFALCPFHQEKTPSFAVKGNYAHCFGCGWSGDTISFVKELFGLDFPDAVRKLISDFSLPLSIDEKPTFRQFRAIKKQYAEMLSKRRAAQEAQERRERRYNKLLDEYCKLDKTIILQMPESPDSEITDEYAEALKKRDYISYLIDTELQGGESDWT